MASTVTFNPTSLPEVMVDSGGTVDPFPGLTVSTNESLASFQAVSASLLTVFASPVVLAAGSLGVITDTSGNGTQGGDGFVEENEIAATTASTVISRLIYTAPVLADGQSIEVNSDMLSFTSATPGGAIDSNIATLLKPVVIDVVTAPAITGTLANQPDNAGMAIQPFFNAGAFAITDPDFANTGTDTATITVSAGGTATDADGLLTGVGLAKIGVGTYDIPNAVSPATLTAVMDNLVFTPSASASGTVNFSVSVTDTKAGLTSTDSTTSVILPAATPTPTPPPPSEISPDLTVFDTTTGQQLGTLAPASPVQATYTGPVLGLASEYINLTSDNINITANTDNWFLHSGSGEDAIQAFGGTNVLDGGTGSNFLVGGGGFDTFFVDARGATADIWSTLDKFVSGDNATMWGITPSMFNVATADGQGAAGFTGLTFHATAPGSPEASLTLTGYTSADLADGKVTETFGTDPVSGSPFMLIHAT